MMRKLISCVAALLLVLTLFAGCGKDTIVGRWRCNFEDETGLRNIFYEFRDDGTVMAVIDGKLQFESTYEVENNCVSILRADGESYYMFIYSFKKGNLRLKSGSTVTEYTPYEDEIWYRVESNQEK